MGKYLRILAMVLWMVGWACVLIISGHCEYESLSLIALATCVIDVLMMITGGIRE